MSATTYSPAAIALIKFYEGFGAYPSSDVGTTQVIGWGHDILPEDTFTTPLSAEDADALLKGDMDKALAIILAAVKVPLNQGQLDALVSFVFNVGGGAFEKSTMLKNINNSDYTAAREQFRFWVHIGGVVSLGLTRRRAAEEDMFNGSPY